MNQTHPRLIFVVVCAIAILAFIGVTSICASLFLHTYADPAILTALITITSGLIGSLTSLLVNTRTAPPQEVSSTQTITTAPKPEVPAPAPSEPQRVEVTNSPANPIPVEETKP
jgi:hypothetical protein